MKSRFFTVIYLMLLAGIVLLAGSQQYHGLFDGVRRIPGGDKLGHFLLMGLLSLLLNVSLDCRTVRAFGRPLLLGSLVACVAVTLEEFSQIFVRYRTFDPVDLFFDYGGIWAFGRLALYLKIRRGRPAE
jgi:polysaccharide biosynthesis protein VpsQ